MKPEDDVLFLTARQRFLPEHAEKILIIQCNNSQTRPLDWERIYQTADSQGIAPLVHKNLSSQPELRKVIPSGLLDHYQLYSRNVLLMKQDRTNHLRQALEYLHSQSIQAILIKGAALDQLVYEQAWYTIFRDIDLILSVRADELPARGLVSLKHRFHRSGIEYDFFSHHDLDMNGMLPVDYQQVWQDAVPIQIVGVAGLVLAADDFLISLCINSCRKQFFRLKSLLDISETLKTTPVENWQRLANRCQQYQCSSIVYTALQATRQTIGINVPDDLRSLLRISPYRAASIHLALSFLLRYWSPAFSTQKTHLVHRRAQLTLMLPYATYSPAQVMYITRRAVFFAKKPPFN